MSGTDDLTGWSVFHDANVVDVLRAPLFSRIVSSTSKGVQSLDESPITVE